MPAGTYNLVIEKGATFERTITWKDDAGNPVDLTGYTARMQIRETVTADPPVVSLTVGSGITLGGAAGTIQIVIDATTTAGIAASQGVYDLELEDGSGKVTRLLAGSVTFLEEVTR